MATGQQRPNRPKCESPQTLNDAPADEGGPQHDAQVDEGRALSRPPQSLIPHVRAASVPSMDDAEYRALVADIAERGIIEPLHVTRGNVVLDGHARQRASIELSLPRVPVRIVAPLEELEYMLKAALRRRNLSAAQRAAVALDLVDYEQLRDEAIERRQANLPGLSSERAALPLRGRTRDYIAKVAGVTPRTVQHVITVRDADPALFQEVKAGRKSAHHEAREIIRGRRRHELGVPGALPDAPFPVIYADPPWASDNLTVSWAPENHYPTLALAKIKALRIPAADDALLFLWAVNCQLPQALEVMKAWGFEYRGNFAWIKPTPGVGQRIRNQHELLLLGVRGSFPCPAARDVPASVIEAARGAHSQKPECVYDLIERMYPDCPKLELFARGTPRPGWMTWGNEVKP